MIRIFLYILAVVYPVLVFIFLVILKIPPRYFSIFIVFLALIFFLGYTSKKKDKFRIFSAGLLGAAGLACLLSNSSFFLKLYPVLMNTVMLFSFSYTLIFPPPLIFRFAILQDKNIKGSLAEKRIEKYCRKVTMVWCAFFILNGSFALWTVLSGSDLLWSVYNGGISYILIGTLFAGEFLIRKMTDKKMPRAIPLSKFSSNSRKADHVLCYEGAWRDGKYKTWKDFLEDTACLRHALQNSSAKSFILHVEDCWYFLCAFTALLQCGKEIWLTANITPAYIDEITAEGSIGFLSDIKISHKESSGEFLFVPSILEDHNLRNQLKGLGYEAAPSINPDETEIIMYTSGSTGRPKTVKQRLTEFEMDNSFILSKWGDEWLSRKTCSTVSQHHIYGLLYNILLPFTAGVPFRRTRIETPEEFEKLNDESYMIITVPAFLKRAVEFKLVEGGTFGLKDPWIYTSAGVLEPDLAERTNELFGFWPLEVYGSTETSGIAWRTSRDGLQWTPFDNAAVTLNDNGCLVIRSPYIKDPAGFATADMAEIINGGKFLLKGRSDSVVKIEEKRISLKEVEDRIRLTAFVSDVCVIAMEDRRQYLAAAVVFNDEGKKHFRDWEIYEINQWFKNFLLRFLESVAVPRKWRYVQAFTLDAQGKNKKEAVQALFENDIIKGRLLSREKLVEKTESAEGMVKAVLDFSVPEESDYFNGHFPQLKVLPAVAQFELAVRFSGGYLGTGLDVRGAKRLKFSSPVLPGAPLRMELVKNGDIVSFTIKSPDGKELYSSGSFAAGETQ
ncbi:MAG: AMP-binding protein [Treponema sp.]|nr:AMP-binding protein [Treponema sp.]